MAINVTSARLRRLARNYGHHFEIMAQAADEWERLQTENAAMQAWIRRYGVLESGISDNDGPIVGCVEIAVTHWRQLPPMPGEGE